MEEAQIIPSLNLHCFKDYARILEIGKIELLMQSTRIIIRLT
jgi:hypothetical protein